MRVTMMGLLIGWMALAGEATGKWKAEFDTQIGQQSYTYEFKVAGKELTGKATHANGSSEIAEGSKPAAARRSTVISASSGESTIPRTTFSMATPSRT